VLRGSSMGWATAEEVLSHLDAFRDGGKPIYVLLEGDILDDLTYFLASHGPMSSSRKGVGTFKWLTTSFEPAVARIQEVRGGNPVQGYCDLLNHRFLLAKARGQDVPNDEALDDWIASGMPGFDVSGATATAV